GQPSEQLVRIFKLACATIGEAKNKLGKTNDRPDCRIRIGDARYERQVARGGVLPGHRQTIWIHKVRMHSSKLLGASVHDLRKRFKATGIIPGQTSCNVVRAFYQQRAQKIDSLISVARL